MIILISVAFGVTIFALTLAACVKTMKTVPLPTTRQKVVEFRATRAAAAIPAPPVLLNAEAVGQFLSMEATAPLRLPRMTVRAGAGDLQIGNPVVPRLASVAWQRQEPFPAAASRAWVN